MCPVPTNGRIYMAQSVRSAVSPTTADNLLGDRPIDIGNDNLVRLFPQEDTGRAYRQARVGGRDRKLYGVGSNLEVQLFLKSAPSLGCRTHQLIRRQTQRLGVSSVRRNRIGDCWRRRLGRSSRDGARSGHLRPSPPPGPRVAGVSWWLDSKLVKGWQKVRAFSGRR